MSAKVVKAQAESMSSIVLNGVTYELTNEPSHGVVRGVRKLQKDISVSLIKKYRNKFSSDVPIEEAMQQIFDEDPLEISNFTDANEEFIIAGTISLATNKIWTFDMIGACRDKEITAAFEKCKIMLDGDVTTFL